MELQKYFLPTAFILLACSAVTNACHGQLLASGVQEAEKQSILKEHNRLRQTVATGRFPGQPGAENMREIVWDDELALRAQKWADNCQFRHDPLRTINRFTMGQNLAIIWSTVPLEADDGDFPSRIQSWFNEVQKYSFGDAWSPKTGHYSQLVWGETSLVGCGYSEYKDTSKYNKLYVCNYGPGGNVVGYNPYEVGKPSCGTYGMRPSSQYQGLCAAPQASSTTTTTSVNSISSNTIETYDYQQTKSFNIKQSTFATQFVQQASSSSSSSSSTKQATSSLAQTLSAAASAASVASGTSVASVASVSSSATATASASSSGVPARNGNSFGTATRGGSTSHTTETNQYGQYTQYKNKFEAYKPSSVEFQNSIRKHTILRTYLNQPQKPQKTQNEQNQKQDQNQQQQHQQQQVNTPKPATRGWSLLSWRG